MSRKTKMYKRSHIRDRKKQEKIAKPTKKELLQNELERLSFETAFIRTI